MLCNTSTEARMGDNSIILLCFVLLASLTHEGQGQTAPRPLRPTTSGPIRGIRRNVLGKDVDVFLGVPFAQPPVDQLRFSRPQPVTPWKEEFDASNLPNACSQLKDTSFNEFPGVKMWNPNTNISEDCLYLNIWQPVGGASGKAAMIWVYGGGFYSGSSALSLYDGSILAAEGDVVVMSMQYRVGPMGFFYLKGGADEKDGALGNMALIDQATAIKWFHNNAAAFGADPKRITLFGESAGAGSVSLHLLSPLNKGIIKSSIMESGSALAPWACDTQERAQAGSLELASLLKCDSGDFYRNISDSERSKILECMRGVSEQDILEKQWELTVERHAMYTAFAPTVDDYFLTSTPTAAAVKDAQTERSIMLGVNQNEGMYFLFYLLQDLFKVGSTEPEVRRSHFEKSIEALFKFDKKFVIDSIIHEYATPINFDEIVNYLNEIDNALGDYYFKCPVIEFAKLYASYDSKVYLYQFNHRTSVNPWPKWSGVLHGYEIDHVFGQPLNTSLGYKQDEKDLSKKMIEYWTNFAKTGDPNKGGNRAPGTAWPVYDTKTRNVLHLNVDNIMTQSGILDKRCAFWEYVYPQLRQASDSLPCSSTRSVSILHMTEVQITAGICVIIAILSRFGFL